jgi:hypothetical protein
VTIIIRSDGSVEYGADEREARPGDVVYVVDGGRVVRER